MLLTGSASRASTPPTRFPVTVTGVKGSLAITGKSATVTATDGIITDPGYWFPIHNPFRPVAPDLDGGSEDATAVTAVTTFHSSGLSWPTANGGSGVVCQVNFRQVGESTWEQAINGWWDDRVGNNGKEYRLSIVHLKAGIEYEARLKLDTGEYKEVTFTTWPIQPGDGSETLLDETSSSTLTIDGADMGVNGTPSARHVYTFDPANGSATIDVAHGEKYCIKIDGAHHITIRGITRKNANHLGLLLTGGSTDIIIEEGETTGWGSEDSAANHETGQTGWGIARQAAIGNRDPGDINRNGKVGTDILTARVVIRRENIHSPAWPTNAWDQPSLTTHPEGPVPIWIGYDNDSSGGGNNVFCYNHIRSQNGNKFFDGFGARFNTSEGGFGSDTDVYGNIIRDIWDDAIETEGGCKNVRVWGNYFDQTYKVWATISITFGPVYFWRNVLDTTDRLAAAGNDNGEAFGKHGGINGAFGGGPYFAFHNIMIQSTGAGDKVGSRQGWNTNSAHDTVGMNTRNNWLWTRDAGANTIKIVGTTGVYDCDWDVTNGGFSVPPGQESHGQTGATIVFLNDVPTYSPSAPSGVYELAPDTDGYEDGKYIPNFSGNVNSAIAPDVGAHEKGRSAMQFGVGAFP